MIFEWPLLLATLALLPMLVLLYAAAQRQRRTYAVRFTNLALLREVAGRRPGARRHLPPLLFLLGLGALCVSLARPHAVIALPLNHAGVVLAIDISSSMEATDLSPTRIAAAREAASAFLETLPPMVQVGLVVFNHQASLRVPLTTDTTAVRRAIADLTSSGGTALGDGLRLAADQFDRGLMGDDGRSGPALVVLLSDGRNRTGQTAPPDAAARAGDLGVTVHTIGMGRREGDGPETLREIARQTGGRYFHVRDTPDLKRIYADLGSHIYRTEERTEITPLVSGVGACFLVIAGLLSLSWFQRLP